MELLVIELEPYLECSSLLPENATAGDCPSHVRQLCEEAAVCLREHGALVIRDPRCSCEDNDRFIDMMERYFGQSEEFKRQQERPHLHYQVGVTPEGVELPRCAVDPELQAQIQQMPLDVRPQLPSGPDPKWRYMWRVGPRPTITRFQELNAEPVVPEGFPEWTDVMNEWGHKMIAAVEVVAEMAALGFGLSKSAFTSLMSQASQQLCDGSLVVVGEGSYIIRFDAFPCQGLQGPHLLAPTGSDLSRYSEEGNVFAGYHYDLNFLSIHGRSRFPGLFIWLRDGRKLNVNVPPGCLLLQAGKQLEWLTGGECRAGMHEVAVSNKTIKAVNAAKESGKSLWRVSSTVFGHIASDAILQPLGHFAESPLAPLYPATVAGEYVEQELAVIKLKLTDGAKGGELARQTTSR